MKRLDNFMLASLSIDEAESLVALGDDLDSLDKPI